MLDDFVLAYLFCVILQHVLTATRQTSNVHVFLSLNVIVCQIVCLQVN